MSKEALELWFWVLLTLLRNKVSRIKIVVSLCWPSMSKNFATPSGTETVGMFPWKQSRSGMSRQIQRGDKTCDR